MIWVFVCGFALLSLIFVLPPLWRGAGTEVGGKTARAQTLRQLYLARREELQRESAGGQLGSADLESALRELDASFLRETDALALDDATPAVAISAPKRNAAVVLAVFSVVLPVVLYQALGEPQAPLLRQAGEIMQLSEADTAALRGWQEVLAERVAKRPREAKSHYLLGHVALKQRRYQAAADAFAAAHVAHGQVDPGIDLYWLQSRFLAAEGNLDAQSRGIAERLLAASPNQPAVYEVLAIDAFNRRDYNEAVSVLNRALSLPLGEAQRASFADGLAQARARLGQGEGDDGPAIDVQIQGLADVPAGSTLFVIARPPGGGMPYAVVRRPGPDFPEQVRLDDSVSMNPAAPLSAAPAVEVVVRASASGQAMRRPDDWQWQSEVLSFADGTERHEVTAQLAPPG
ncbi:MAG: c-type cytochrome biogenesis protein CcmI [Pseudomonadales bacterium]